MSTPATIRRMGSTRPTTLSYCIHPSWSSFSIASQHVTTVIWMQNECMPNNGLLNLLRPCTGSWRHGRRKQYERMVADRCRKEMKNAQWKHENYLTDTNTIICAILKWQMQGEKKKMDDIVYMNLINSSLWSLARSCLVNEAINGRFNQLELRDNNYCFVGAFSSAANGWIIGDGVDEVHSISFYVRCTALPDQMQLNGMQEYTRRKHIINKIWYKIASNNSP